MSNVSAVTKFFPTVNEGFSTTLGAGGVLAGGATIPLNTTSGLTDGSVFVGIIEPGQSKQQTFTGTVDTSGAQIINVKWTRGTNADHLAGVTIVDYVTGTALNMMNKGILVHANQDGTLANNAITSAAQITDGIIGDAEMATAVKPVTLFNENTFDHVVSGLVITADSVGVNRNYSVSSGVVMINGKRLTVAAVSAQTVTASKDRYVDATDSGNGTAALSTTAGEVTNNTASFALPANSVRIGIVVAGATTIATAASINQGQEDRVLPIASSVPYAVTDSLGNLICPRDPNRKTLGYRQITTSATTTSTTAVQATGLSVPVIIPAGRKVKISSYTPYLTNTAANVPTVTIWDGTVGSGTQLQQYNGIASNTLPSGAYLDIETTPVATSKTYNVGINNTASGTVTYTAVATAPSYIKVELV